MNRWLHLGCIGRVSGSAAEVTCDLRNRRSQVRILSGALPGYRLATDVSGFTAGSVAEGAAAAHGPICLSLSRVSVLVRGLTASFLASSRAAA